MEKYIIDEVMYEKIREKSLVICYNLKDDLFNINNQNIELDKLFEYIKKYNRKYKYIIFYFNFLGDKLTLKQSDKLVCSIKKLEKIKELNNKPKYIYIKSNDSPYEQFVITSALILNIHDKKDRYEKLYDSICDYLDDRVIKTNACGFKDDKCIAKRDTNCTMGCCHHYKNKLFGVLYEKELMLCEYQKDKKCSAKCITCKMYMCDTLKKKGYSFNTRNVILIKRYFNPFQKIVIKTNFFTPKDKILKRINNLSI